MIEPTPRARHARSKEVLFGALDLPSEEREEYLREACADDAELLEEVRSLLAEFTRLDGFLDRPVTFSSLRHACPEHLGKYRVIRLLGHGGMGIVYLAEQPGTRRPVALKVLRLDAATEAAQARFAREAEVLARFRHPGIAQVHEAVVVETDLGPQPVICMEFVDGLPIIEHARRAGLGRRERIELVLRVADALAHAHAGGVLHRDLKPDNVLVGTDGSPRILDFGIAQVVDDEGTLVTRTGQVLGTISYMSPEQARGGRVDERADLFSLGVILYELLTGELPYETRGALVHEALRTLTESEASLLSSHDASLRGDLDVVLARALASEPGRRYSSVTDFAADLEAVLCGRPITARAPSPLYLLTRFVGRHKALSLAVLLICLALGSGTVIALQALIREDKQMGYTELFADRNLLSNLREEAGGLWPANSTRVPEMDDWLRRAHGVVGRLDGHHSRVEQLTQARGSLDPGAAVDPEWLIEEGQALVRQLEEFSAVGGLLEEIERRREDAASLRRLTVVERAASWAAAADRVAEDPRFNVCPDFRLTPQEGLVPLGPDPDSGLEEFAHHGATGSVPARDPATGRLLIEDGTAVVFVLLPGGRHLVGDPRDLTGNNPSAHDAQYDAGTRASWGPPVPVELDPYLIGKYELTQAQFLAAFGTNPSDFGIGDVWFDVPTGPRNPVESVSWDDAVELLPRLGFDLPTEAQWEVAARAGTESPWIAGDSVYDLLGFANIAASINPPPGYGEGELGDGFYSHAPVGSFAPNAYGMYDVIGNVWELCRDVYKVAYHELEHRPGDGLVVAEPDGDISRRGSAFLTSAQFSCVFSRGDRRHGSPDPQTGIRPIWHMQTAPSARRR